MVLAGLGTSMCVKDGEFSKAPTMLDLWEFVETEWIKYKGNEYYLPFSEVLEILEFNIADDSGVINKGITNSASERIPKSASKLDSVGMDKNIEKLLNCCDQVMNYGLGIARPIANIFFEHAKQIINEKVNFIKEEDVLPVHEKFLRRLVESRVPGNRLSLYTTNYDICFEQSANAIGFVAIDGFKFTRRPIFDSNQFTFDIVEQTFASSEPTYIKELFKLFKIHGSIDWKDDIETDTIY